jgi:hypothetical protein
MKMMSWILLGLSVLVFLCGVYSKMFGMEGWLLGFQPGAWWRASISFVMYALAFSVISRDPRA